MEYLHKQLVKVLAKSNKNISEALAEQEKHDKQMFQRFYLFRGILLACAILITLIVLVIERRKRLCPQCCRSHFALIIPVRFLEDRRDRLLILTSFGITTLDVIRILVEKDLVAGHDFNPFIKIGVRFLLVMATCFLCLPFLICYVCGTYLTLIIGLFYVIGYMCIMLMDDDELKLKEGSVHDFVKAFAADIFTVVFGIILIYGYCRKIYKKRLNRKSDQYFYKYQKLYVKNLLSGTRQQVQVVESNSKFWNTIKNFTNKIYYNIPGFRYSVSILVSITVGFVAITYLFTRQFAEIYDAYTFFNHIMDLYLGAWKDVPMPNIIEQLGHLVFKDAKIEKEAGWTVFEFAEEQLFMFLGCCLAAVVVAYLTVIYIILHMLHSYRTNVLSLFRRKEDEHLLQIKKIKNVKVVVSAIQYSGYQVAYLVWGAHVQYFTLVIVFVLLSEIVFLPFKYAVWPVIKEIFNKVAPILLMMIFTKGTQLILVKFFFLQERGKLLALDNRRGFFVMMYFMFYYNIYMGLFSCVLRMAKAVVFGLWFIPRLDRSIFPRTFENLDGGFRAYTCLIKLETMQSNVIVITFVNLLLQTKRNPNLLSCNGSLVEMDKEILRSKRSHVARNRWFVAYTLIRNPSLIEKRGPHVFIDDFYERFQRKYNPEED